MESTIECVIAAGGCSNFFRKRESRRTFPLSKKFDSKFLTKYHNLTVFISCFYAFFLPVVFPSALPCCMFDKTVKIFFKEHIFPYWPPVFPPVAKICAQVFVHL
jgi:hypothetical protein